MPESTAGQSGFAAEARERARLDRERQQARGSTHWPGWRCNNCHAEYPEDTTVVKCPGKGKRCGGTLARWQNYEVKTS